MVFFEKSSRFKRVDYREVPPSGRLNNKKIKKDEVSSEENTSSDVDRINDTQKETTGKSKKGKKNEPMKKETGKSKSTGTKVDITDDSDNDDNDNNEIESLDEGEDFADLVKQFKARSGASKLHLKGVPIDEINNAKLTALQELARFKRSLEPFLTEKGK